MPPPSSNPHATRRRSGAEAVKSATARVPRLSCPTRRAPRRPVRTWRDRRCAGLARGEDGRLAHREAARAGTAAGDAGAVGTRLRGRSDSGRPARGSRRVLTCRCSTVASVRSMSPSSASAATTSGLGWTPRARRRSCTPRSMPASTSSTPRISTAKAGAKSTSGARVRGRRDATPSSPRSSATSARRSGTARGRSTSAQALEGSLARLGTDYVDLYQMHQPDPDTPIADTLGALDEPCAPARCARSAAPTFPSSSFARRQAAAKPGAARFVSVQNEYSLFERDAGAGRARGVRAAGARLPSLLSPRVRPAHGQVPPHTRQFPPAGSSGGGRYGEPAHR